jgi:hypothetical protein
MQLQSSLCNCCSLCNCRARNVHTQQEDSFCRAEQVQLRLAAALSGEWFSDATSSMQSLGSSLPFAPTQARAHGQSAANILAEAKLKPLEETQVLRSDSKAVQDSTHLPVSRSDDIQGSHTDTNSLMLSHLQRGSQLPLGINLSVFNPEVTSFHSSEKAPAAADFLVAVRFSSVHIHGSRFTVQLCSHSQFTVHGSALFTFTVPGSQFSSVHIHSFFCSKSVLLTCLVCLVAPCRHLALPFRAR